MSVRFSRFHPSNVIGGTYSGQIDPPSSSYHTHPVYCLDVVGSQNAHNLISISTDVKLCLWNLDMLWCARVSPSRVGVAPNMGYSQYITWPFAHAHKFTMTSPFKLIPLMHVDLVLVLTLQQCPGLLNVAS